MSREKTNRLASFILLLTALVYAGFAVWLGGSPKSLMNLFGVDSAPPQMLTEIRAFYGGLEMAIAVLMLLFWKRGELNNGLLVGGLPLGGAAIVRCIGMMVDGFTNIHFVVALVEASGCILCLIGYYLVSKPNSTK